MYYFLRQAAHFGMVLKYSAFTYMESEIKELYETLEYGGYDCTAPC